MSESNKIGACAIIKRILRFFICGPKGPLEIILWGLIWYITIPVWFISQFIIGLFEVIAGEMKGTAVYIEGGDSGDGMFDEVSCRRREDIKFLLGKD